MKVLQVASECVPFVKTGGLADVVGALPKALAALGVETRVLLPMYAPLKRLARRKGAKPHDLGQLFGGPARLVAMQSDGLHLWLLDAPHLYAREGGIYLDGTGRDWPDNAERFAALAQVAARVAVEGVDGWRPDVVHAHDWQGALAPWYLRQNRATMPSVLTIHNIAFQGVFPASLIDPLKLDRAGFSRDGFEFWGKISFLKAGINAADRITTVSPTYAGELMLPDFGMGLEGVLRARKERLSGILNGIDLDVWNPETDPAIARTYSLRSRGRKADNKRALQGRFGLKEDPAALLFCVVSRLTEQKGLDLLLQALPALTGRGAQLAVLGSGDKALEEGYRRAAKDNPGTVGAIIGYDEDLSHLMQAGADAILIPSRFEPCGLTQLYGLRYGTLPIVARTGGLADTVIDANAAAVAAGCATGVQFAPVTAEVLEQAIHRTCDLFADRRQWSAMTANAMRRPFGWDASAKAYRALFRSLVEDAASAGATG